jgi:hypothetical protein
MNKFILIYKSSDNGNDFRLVGPFPSDPELSAWGEHWQVENGGDPRWNAIELPEFGGPVYPLPVTVPEKADLGLLDDNIAELKRKLKGYKELRKIVRGRKGECADREGSPIARSA